MKSLPPGDNITIFNKIVSSVRVTHKDQNFEFNTHKILKGIKNLFVDVLQDLHCLVYTCLANRMCEVKAKYVNIEHLIYFKALLNILKFLHTAKERSWLQVETNDNPYYIHSILCLPQSMEIFIISCLCQNKNILQSVTNG